MTIVNTRRSECDQGLLIQVFLKDWFWGCQNSFLFKLTKNSKATHAEIVEFNFVSKLFLLIEISFVVFDTLRCKSAIVFAVAAILFLIFLRSVWANSDGNGFDLPLWDFKRLDYFVQNAEKMKIGNCLHEFSVLSISMVPDQIR